MKDSTKEEIGWGIAIVGGVFTIAACLVALPVFYIYGKTSGGH